MKLTLADFIAMNVRSFPDRQALEVLGDVPESYTYRDMWLRVSALAGALREVEPGPHGRWRPPCCPTAPMRCSSTWPGSWRAARSCRSTPGSRTRRSCTSSTTRGRGARVARQPPAAHEGRRAWDAGRHGSSCPRAARRLPGSAARLLVPAAAVRRGGRALPPLVGPRVTRAVDRVRGAQLGGLSDHHAGDVLRRRVRHAPVPVPPGLVLGGRPGGRPAPDRGLVPPAGSPHRPPGPRCAVTW